jgi:trehalose/maltose hydrolase-like predicted phosphorylase
MVAKITDSPSSAQTLAVGPLTCHAARQPSSRADSDPFATNAAGEVDAVATTFARPIFQHSVSWNEFAKDPNRYAAQFFIGNGNYCETGITASAAPMKDHSRPGYDDVYVQIEYAATFKAGVSVFRTTDVEGGRTVANSCCPHLPYLCYHRVCEPGRTYFHNSIEDRERFEVVNGDDADAIQNRVEEGTVAYTLALRDRETGHTLTQRLEKLASFDDPSLACARLELEADFAGDLIIVSGFDGTLINNLYAGYNQFQQAHTERGPRGTEHVDARTVAVSLQTTKESESNLVKLEACEYEVNPDSTTPAEVRNQTQYQFGFAKRVRYFAVDDGGAERELEPEFVGAEEVGGVSSDPQREIYVVAKLRVQPGQRIVIEDRTALVTSIDSGLSGQAPLDAARAKVCSDERYAAAKQRHVDAWQRQFSQARIALFGGPRAMEFQAPLDLCRAALLKTVSGHNRNIAADMGAKGLHDGRYRTHNFWEMAILFWKVKALQDPAAAKGLARLYIQNIDSARAYAKAMGRSRGAQFGWQTTADGKPDTQVVKWNPVAQQLDPDFSKFQPHNNWAFFYGIDQIYRVSGDREFLVEAMPLLIELVRFGAECCEKQADGKYHTIGLMDPNEFNEKLPGSTLPNLPDTFYNNFMIAKMAARLSELLGDLAEADRKRILAELDVSNAELAQIESLATNMFFPVTTEAKRVPIVDLDGKVHGQFEVPAGTIENYAGFTEMPMVYWPTMRAWLDAENEQRIARGVRPIRPHFAPSGVVPRADQVLKAVELRAPLAGVVADILVARGTWTKETDPADPKLTLVRSRESGDVVWKLDARSNRVFGGAVSDADIRAYAGGTLPEGQKQNVRPVLNSPDNFQVGKQQGALQTVGNFAAQEVIELLRANGYAVDMDTVSRNVEYYDKHVNTNGSSLSNVGTGVGKISLGELHASVDNYDAVVNLDAKDTEPGTARQGFRAGNMAASELMLLIYLGLDVNAPAGKLSLDPKLPKEIGGIELLDAAYGKYRLYVRANGETGRLFVRATGLGGNESLSVAVAGQVQEVRAGQTNSFEIPRAG